MMKVDAIPVLSNNNQLPNTMLGSFLIKKRGKEKMKVDYYKPMSLDFIEEFWEDLDMNLVIQKQNLPEDFISKHINKLDTNALARYQKLSVDFIKEKWEWFDKNIVMQYIVMPMEWIAEKWDELKNTAADTIAKYQKITVDFIQEKWDTWSTAATEFISKYQKLTVDFIKEKWDYLDKNYISQFQTLTTDFIKDSLSTLNAKAVAVFQIIEDSVRTLLGLPAPAATITGNQILAFDPCSDGMARFNAHTPDNNTVLTWNELLRLHGGTQEGNRDIHWLSWKLGKSINT